MAVFSCASFSTEIYFIRCHIAVNKRFIFQILLLLLEFIFIYFVSMSSRTFIVVNKIFFSPTCCCRCERTIFCFFITWDVMLFDTFSLFECANRFHRLITIIIIKFKFFQWYTRVLSSGFFTCIIPMFFFSQN